jgi:ketosteroid isomerase-like protein
METAASPELLKLAIERFECWNRHEFDEMQSMYAEDAVFDVSAVFTDVPPKHGQQEMRSYWDELHETWAGVQLEPLEALDLGQGRYVVDLRLSAEGQRSGAEVEQRLAMLYTVRPEDGKVILAELFADVPAAEAAAISASP